MKLVKPYRVFVNDTATEVKTVRVSRFPYNRHWPGYQRSLEQTELTGFVSFDLIKTTQIRVECDFDFREVVLRPISLGIHPTVVGKTVLFDLNKPCQAVLEFDGISGALHLFADPPMEYILPENDLLYFGPGEHDAGHIELHSGQTVFIDKDAVVYGEIYATDVENIRIIGKGILDHSKINHAIVADGFCDPLRPSPIVIRYSKNIEICGIVIRDPYFLAVRPIACENVHIDNIKIIGCWRYNSDGIDFINTINAVVENCFVRSFDDSLCLKGFASFYQEQMYHNGRTYDVMENIVFRNCVIFNDWGKALEVGIDLCASEIRNCRFENCDIIHATGPAMDISNADYADVHDIVFDNIRIEHSANAMQPTIQQEEDAPYNGENSDYQPLLMLCSVFYTDEYSSQGEKRGKIHDITFHNIRLYSPQMLPSEFHGYNDLYSVNNVIITDLFRNDCRLTDCNEANISIKEHAHNIVLK